MSINGSNISPALCLDLDGTVRYSKRGEFIKGADDVALFPGVEKRIWEYRNNGFLVVGISNQGGVAFGYKTMEEVQQENMRMVELFKENPFHQLLSCGNHPDGNVHPWNCVSLLRKPNYGMLAIFEYQAFEVGGVSVDWSKSLMVGDREEDQQLAENAGISFQWAWEFFAGNRKEP